MPHPPLLHLILIILMSLTTLAASYGEGAPSGLGGLPEGMVLKQVIVLARHGERSPVSARSIGTIPLRWNLCHIASRYRASVAALTSLPPDSPGPHPGHKTAHLDITPIVMSKPGEEGIAKVGDCAAGELTDVGYATCAALGRRLRRHYIDELAFIPPQGSPYSPTHFRSTSVPRTLASLHSLISGLYPHGMREEGWAPKVFTISPKEETLFPSRGGCARLQVLDREAGEAAARKWNPGLGDLDGVLGKYLGGRKIRVDGSPRASGIMDTIRAAKANGLEVPPEFEDPTIVGNHEWFDMYQNPEARRLSMGPFLSEVLHHFSTTLSLPTTAPPHAHSPRPTSPAREEPKLSILSAHDTTIAGLLSSLEAFDWKWPGFTAFVEIQAMQREVSGAGGEGWVQKFWAGGRRKENFVRLRYNGKAISLPGCASKGDHLEGDASVCTMQAFAKIINNITPVDWTKECEVVVPVQK